MPGSHTFHRLAAGSAIPAMPLLISPLKALLAPKVTAVMQRWCEEVKVLPPDMCQVNTWT